MAFAMESVLSLAERGHKIDLVVNKHCEPKLEIQHPNIIIHEYQKDKFNRVSQYYLFHKLAMQVAIEKKYHLVIGLSQIGLIVAAYIGWKLKVPYIFFNDEIWFGNERPTFIGKLCGHLMKFFERKANRNALFTVTQDPMRGKFLASVNKIQTKTLRYLPNSKRGQSQIRNVHTLYDMLGITYEKPIILWIGGVSPNDGALELAQEATNWPDIFYMVYHFRTDKLSPYMNEIKKFNGVGQVLISDKTVSYEDTINIFASATIGLGFYADRGINARFIGHSSGKINSFLQAGIPCIVRDFEGLRWVEEDGAGVCVKGASDVLDAGKRIIKQYALYQKSSVNSFNNRLAFESCFSQIMDEIEEKVIYE
jgi:hypothetical protein